jgi:hypothetical protein
MAVTLIFEDRGWTVVTSAYTLAAKGQDSTELCYMWGDDSVSWFDSATGTARTTLETPIETLIQTIRDAAQRDGIADLRVS